MEITTKILGELRGDRGRETDVEVGETDEKRTRRGTSDLGGYSPAYPGGRRDGALGNRNSGSGDRGGQKGHRRGLAMNDHCHSYYKKVRIFREPH